MSYVPIPRRKAILRGIENNQDLIIITLLTPFDLLITGLLILYAMDFSTVQTLVSAEPLIHNVFKLQPGMLAAIETRSTVQIQSQLLNRLLMIKSIIWTMLIFKIARYTDE